MPTSQIFFNFKGKGVVAKPGASVFLYPWGGNKTATGMTGRTQDSASLGGGVLQSVSGNQNDEVTWDIWLDAGTYKYAQVAWFASSHGIYSVQLDTVEKGTIDSYNGVTTKNNYSEITGIVVAAAGLKSFKLKMATKNGSSSAYYGVIQSSAWIRTGA